MSAAKKPETTFWIMGSFKVGETCLAAVRALRAAGETELDVYSNYPLHGAEDALGLKKSKVPLIVLCCALFGAANGYGIQTWANAVGDLPFLSGPWLGSLRGYLLNVGARDAHSWALNVPVTFELGVLLGAFGAVFGMFILNGLPRLHHPVFEVEAFRSAQIDRYWISVTTKDPAKVDALKAKLAELTADDISMVEEGGE